jgi:hypothetical protein
LKDIRDGSVKPIARRLYVIGSQWIIVHAKPLVSVAVMKGGVRRSEAAMHQRRSPAAGQRHQLCARGADPMEEYDQTAV